jgi:hypothetical protein
MEAGGMVREVLDNVFAANPQTRSSVVDDQAALCSHMAIFVDGEFTRHRVGLTETVAESAMIYMFQALFEG